MPSRGGSPNLVSDFARDADTCHLEPMPTLSWETVKKISERFASLNPYSFGGTILEIKEINYEGEDKSKPFRELFGDAVSAKRYCLFIGKHAKEIIDGKAHGIGYLMAPRGLRRNEAENGWTNEFWSAVLKGEGISCKNGAPEWLDRPAMMKIPVSSPAVLGRLKKSDSMRSMRWWRRESLRAICLPAAVSRTRPLCTRTKPSLFNRRKAMATAGGETESQWARVAEITGLPARGCRKDFGIFQMDREGPADEGVGFHNMLVFFFFAFVELLGKIILHTHLADGM